MQNYKPHFLALSGSDGALPGCIASRSWIPQGYHLKLGNLLGGIGIEL